MYESHWIIEKRNEYVPLLTREPSQLSGTDLNETWLVRIGHIEKSLELNFQLLKFIFEFFGEFLKIHTHYTAEKYVENKIFHKIFLWSIEVIAKKTGSLPNIDHANRFILFSRHSGGSKKNFFSRTFKMLQNSRTLTSAAENCISVYWDLFE